MKDSTWSPVMVLVDNALQRLDLISDETVARIREDLTDFVLVPYDEHRNTVRDQLRRRLLAFRDRRAWGPVDIEQAVVLAQRRARQGISIDVLISAYHVGDRELWRNLSTEPGGARALLPDLATLMLESMQTVSTTLASAHSKETWARDRMKLSVSQRLIDLLNTNAHDTETARLAEYLGFVPELHCVAIAYLSEKDEPESAEQLDLERAGKAAIARAGLGTTHIMLVQSDEKMLGRIVHALTTSSLIGIGGSHSGIAGAARSLKQAQIALAAATQQNKVSIFADNWNLSCVLNTSELLDDDVLHIADLAHAHPPLRETIGAFAQADMSVTQCARASHLHPNTVIYRLARWRDLTGWDARTFSGLGKSLIACALADRQLSRPS